MIGEARGKELYMQQEKTYMYIWGDQNASVYILFFYVNMPNYQYHDNTILKSFKLHNQLWGLYVNPEWYRPIL